LGPRDAKAQPPSARAELEQGYALRKKGNFVDALPHLLESYRLDPQLKTLINLADCEEHIGKLVDAKRHWDKARTQAAGQGDTEIEEEAQRRLSILDKRVPTLTIQLPPGQTLTLRIDEDGFPVPSASIGEAVLTDPGHHTIIVHAEGHEDRSFDVILQAGAPVVISVTPGPKKAEAPGIATSSTEPSPEHDATSSSSPLRLTGLVAAGIGVLGLGVGTYFGIVAIEKQQDAHCPGNVCTPPSGKPDVLREANDAGKLSTAFIVGGGVFVAAGAALWLFGPRAGGPQVALAPAMLRDGAGASLDGRW
jgi:serine/threonine-protein kinase